MEKEEVKRSLDCLQKDVKAIEFVTDASTAIKSLLGKLAIIQRLLELEPLNLWNFWLIETSNCLFRHNFG